MKMGDLRGTSKDVSSYLQTGLQNEEHTQIRSAYLSLRSCDADSEPSTSDIRSLECAGWKLDGQSPITLYRGSVDHFLRAELGRKLRPFQAMGTSESADACLVKYLEAEESCHEYNNYFLSGEWKHDPIANILNKARRLIKDVLQDFSWTSVIQDAWNGPGSTFSTEDGRTADFYKFVDLPYLCTDELYEQKELLFRLVWQNRQWRRAILSHRNIQCLRDTEGYASIKSSRSAFEFYFPHIFFAIEGNRYTTVPKEAVIDRPITIEPMINMMVQKGIGQAIRKAFAKAGVILDDWQEVQRRLVTVMGNATLDLSSASDLICYELVRILVPHKWFEALTVCRSSSSSINDSWHDNQKFSGMGNGFTFELESLIFWALAYATIIQKGLPPVADIHPHSQYVSVFGDDIIVNDAAAEAVQLTLASCGFRVNTRKSFSGDKVLRESCGEYTLCGQSIRVFNLKKLDTVGDLYVAYNQNLQLIHFYEPYGYFSLVEDLQRINDLIVDLLRKRGSLNWVPFGLGYDTGCWRFSLPSVDGLYQRDKRWWKRRNRDPRYRGTHSKDYPCIVLRTFNLYSVTFNGNIHFRLISNMRFGRVTDITRRGSVRVRHVERVLPIDQLKSCLVGDLVYPQL